MSMRTRILHRLAGSPKSLGARVLAAGPDPTRPAREADSDPAARESDSAGPPVFLPDLTIWHRWHAERRSFPPGWEAGSVSAVCRRQGLAIWQPIRPWRVEYQGLRVDHTQEEQLRETRWYTSGGTLVARWTLGPDGDWWQTEYPAPTAELLPGAREIVESVTYIPLLGTVERAREEVGEDGVVAVELPMRPLSELLHSFLGWSEGLLLLWESPEAIGELARVLEEKLQALLATLTEMPGDLFLSPDNLDGQFLSPDTFTEHLAPSYRDTVTRLRGTPLVVHAGGPLRALLPSLADCGVQGVEGVSGPPQSDATLAEAREAAGAGLTLWGGIPQDAVLPSTEPGAFESALAGALDQAREPRMILGIADRVPPEVVPERLTAARDAVG
jgi:hypothetical protein